MKTYDEAMDLLCREKVDFTAEEARRHFDEMAVDLDSRVCIAREVTENPKTLTFLVTLASSILNQHPLTFHEYNSVFMSIFINGVLIGLEMNRMELPDATLPAEVTVESILDPILAELERLSPYDISRNVLGRVRLYLVDPMEYWRRREKWGSTVSCVRFED